MKQLSMIPNNQVSTTTSSKARTCGLAKEGEVLMRKPNPGLSFDCKNSTLLVWEHQSLVIKPITCKSETQKQNKTKIKSITNYSLYF